MVRKAKTGLENSATSKYVFHMLSPIMDFANEQSGKGRGYAARQAHDPFKRVDWYSENRKHMYPARTGLCLNAHLDDVP